MHKIPSQIALGTDLELFLYDNETSKIVPCVGILEGTKDNPYRPDGVPEGFAIQEDNVMVEYNIPPSLTSGEFRSNVKKGRTMVLKELHRLYGDRYTLSSGRHYHKFKTKDLASKQAQTIGCDPDYDAYTGGQVRVNPPSPGLLRSCGGHIHLGGDFQCPDFVAALFAELFVGLVVGMSVDEKNDPRAKWYGQPGIYRPKPYGIEYRTPNNSWAHSSIQTERVAPWGLACARYLTTTSAVDIQTAFRQIPWTQVRECMLRSNDPLETSIMRMNIIHKARKAGVPL